MKNKWKDLYDSNKNRKYCEITGIKKDNIILESNPTQKLKEKLIYIVIGILVLTMIILYSFRNDIKVALFVLAFFVVTGFLYVIFNYFKIECKQEGLSLKFGIQTGMFKYDRIKSIYISKFNDSSYIPFAKNYSIVIRYVDGFNRIKELFFSTAFLPIEQVEEFLNNFNTKEAETNRYIVYERFKLLKKIGKILLFVIFIFTCIYLGMSR